MICARWSSLRRAAIHSHRCCGPARACASSAKTCATWATLLYRLDYRLQANRKTREGASHPDRDAQFRYINDQVKAVVELIAATTTEANLKVRCQLDPNTYPAGIKVADVELEAVNLTRHDFHGEWNDTISPTVLALEQ